MKKYYWDNENGTVISSENLELIRSEFYPDDSMEKFMSDCSYLNNGSIEPLHMEIMRQEKLLRSIKEEAEEVQKYIDYLKTIDKE